MPWWENNTLRMVQFNLQQEDAAVDVERVVSQLKEFHANAVMTGAGGITAYYPTALPWHYRSPSLGDGDMLGEMVRLCHSNGIRVIARFDFSKIHESVAMAHPDWLYRDAEGNIVNYHGMVHTCLSGEYQQVHSLEILKECLTQYPVDGIYINMFGYKTYDYDGVNHGICHCENCVRQYEQETGKLYPMEKTDRDRGGLMLDPTTDALKDLFSWQQKRSQEMTRRVIQVVKSINPEISVCTHASEPIVDMTHTESNTALRRPLPLWIYPSFENVRLTNDQQNRIYSANCVINAADIGWRFTGVSSAFNQLKLWQQMAAGGQLEWCIVGTPDRYPDKTNFEGVREIFGFHEKNERYFGQRRTKAPIALVRISDSFPKDDGRMDEFRGILRMLKEGHYLFDIITEENLARLGKQYRLIILPDSRVDPSAIPEGANVIATGGTFRGNARALHELFGAEYVRTEEKTLGAYLLNDHNLCKRMPLRDWLILYDRIDLYRGEGMLPYMAAGVFGPVEITGGVYPSEFNSILSQEKNGVKHMLLPWWPGRLYTRYGYMDHRDLVLDLVDSILGQQDFRLEAPDQVDAYYDGCPGGRMIQLVNLTGFDGVSIHEPVPVHGITAEVPAGRIRRVVDLRTEEELPFDIGDGRLKLKMPVLQDYAAVLLEEDPE